MCIPFALLHSMRFGRPQDALNLFIRYLLCASVFQFLCMVRCNQSHLELNLGSSKSRQLWPDPRARD